MNRNRPMRSFLAAIVLLFSSQLASAASIRNPNDDPLFGDAVAGERFGTSIVVDGATAAVGSFEGRDAQGNATGSVRVFTKQGDAWVLQAKLVAPDDRSAFGSALALEGDTLIVGAPHHRHDGEHYVGAVHVFEREGAAWNRVQTLMMPAPIRSAFFGNALALAGDTLAVGAPQADVDGALSAGSVTVFERNAQGWHAEQTISAPNPSLYGMFGEALAVAGDEILVGAYGENLQAGAVYSFARSDGAWTMRQRLVGSEVAQSDWYGVSLAADDGRLLVGAPAYLQGRNGYAVEWHREDGAWVESGTLRPANETGLRHFGLHVAHRGGDAWFVGAERHGVPHAIVGVDVYTYKPVAGELALAAHTNVPYVGNPGYGLDWLATDGTQAFLGLSFRVTAPWSDAGEVLIVDQDGSQSSLSAGVTATYESFGQAVVANSHWLLVGTPAERRQSAQSGAVFAYDLTDFQTTPAAAVIDPDGERGDAFGTALALSGDTLLVGSPYDEPGGSVQAWEYADSQWQRAARWSAPAPGYAFGSVLAADPATVVVGAPHEASLPEAPEGAAYAYERDGAGWLPPVRLSAGDPLDNEVFATSVAVDGEVLVVGSLTYEVGAWGEPILLDGVARVFERGASGWAEVAQLARPASQEPDADFGSAVAVVGDTVFVSAPAQREVHVFRRQAGQWLWTQRIAAPAAASGRFGERIEVSDGDLWVSAPDYVATQRGSLHRYVRSGASWAPAQSIPASSPQPGEVFGADFAVESGIAYAGVPWAAGYAPFVRAAGRIDIETVNVFASGFEE